jgi:hypothetical protein
MDPENGATGKSDIEGKAVSERSRGDASDIDGQTREVEWAGAHESTWATSEFQLVRVRLSYWRLSERNFTLAFCTARADAINVRAHFSDNFADNR